MCVLILKKKNIYDLFFEKTYNNITDYNHPEFTGGIEYIFNPFRHFRFTSLKN